jgi:cellulose biosynthesis protein BcsQ
MDRKSVYVAFSNQKGGVGKSAITTLFSSYLHYAKGKNVVLIDCDYPQHSIKALRDRDMDSVNNNPEYKEMFFNQSKQTGKKAYPVLTAEPTEAVGVVDKFLAESETTYDVALFDLPGTVFSSGVLDVLLKLDYLFCPIITDRMVMQSSLAFVSTIKGYLEQHRQFPLKDIYLFWNKVNKTENRQLYNQYNAIIKKLNLEILKTELPDTIKYKKEMTQDSKPFFRSTLFPPNNSILKGSNLEELTDEICQIVKL